MNNSVRKDNQAIPPPAIHGAVVYNFHELKKIGDFFLLADTSKRYNVYSALRNYNKKNGFAIKIKTKATTEGLMVTRRE